MGILKTYNFFTIISDVDDFCVLIFSSEDFCIGYPCKLVLLIFGGCFCLSKKYPFVFCQVLVHEYFVFGWPIFD